MMGTANPFGRPQQSYYQPVNMNTYAMPMVYGRMVNSEADILPNQIPNDGSASYFPSSDGSKIYFRAWQQDGTIMKKTYILTEEPIAQPVNATCAEVQNGFAQQSTQMMLNGIENGISSLGYDQLAQMNGINSNITNAANGIVSAINQSNITAMQNANAAATQLADCCCQTREAIQGVNYNMSQAFCNLGNQIQQATQQVIQNDNANYRALHDEFVQFQMSQKDDVIAELRTQVQALNLGVSQRVQNDYLVSQLRPCPTPAYVVPNPFGCGNTCGNCC